VGFIKKFLLQDVGCDIYIYTLKTNTLSRNQAQQHSNQNN